MKFITLILCIYVAIQTISYGIFEYKKNSNKIAGIFICIIGVLTLVTPVII